MKLPVLIRISPLWSLCPLWCILLVLCTTSCERRELTYYNESEITLTADWSKADLEEESGYGATAIFYPQQGGKPRTVLMGERGHATIRLPKGKYDAIIFNRSFDDFNNLQFRGEESLKTLEAYAKQVDTWTGTRIIISELERLATAVVYNFEVTDEMLGNYAPATTRTSTCPDEACRILFTPTPATLKTQVELCIKGLDNLKKATCTISEIPLSVFLYDGSVGTELGSQKFTTDSPVFNEGSQTEGKLTGTLNLFGFNKETPPLLTLQAQLIDDKTTVEQQIGNIDIRKDESGNGIITLYMEADSTEPLPNVKPEGGSGSGFDANVEDWDDETVTEIPI